MENAALGPKKVPRKELLEMLKLEQTVLDGGGYGSTVGTPREDPLPFRDSVTCLNFGRTGNEPREPCEQCWLMAFVPGDKRTEALPCHHIPLNERGETVASLRSVGDSDRLQEALGEWLHNSIARLHR